MKFTLKIIVLIGLFHSSFQHGYLIDPPARSSAWLLDDDFYECCQEYNHNQMFCGGKSHQWIINQGKCSICGEAWDEPNKKFEKGGEKYLGYILREYKTGSVMDVTVEITANHLGHFEFRICKIDDWKGDATQECLDKNILYLVNSTEFKYPIKEDYSSVNLKIQLPDGFRCDHCVFQWKYSCGNDWGINIDDEVKEMCVGCGEVQENFMGCADIAIKDNIVKTTRPPMPNFNKITKSENEIEYKPACGRKLEFGNYLNFNNIVDIFCEQICNENCKNLITVVEKNLENKIHTEPNDDLLTCLDTCPTMCDCS